MEGPAALRGISKPSGEFSKGLVPPDPPGIGGGGGGGGGGGAGMVAAQADCLPRRSGEVCGLVQRVVVSRTAVALRVVIGGDEEGKWSRAEGEDRKSMS